jgi:hypothetical protein
MWAQTPYAVILAVLIPTGMCKACKRLSSHVPCWSASLNACDEGLLLAGYHDKELDIECTETTLKVQPQNSPPVIDRLLSGRVDCSRPLETYR